MTAGAVVPEVSPNGPGRRPASLSAALAAAVAVAADAGAMLALARSRATSPGEALQAWRQACAARWQGLRRLPTATIQALTRTEGAARPAGLGLGQADPLQHAPWHCPPQLAGLPLAELPPHPAIDGAWLAARAPAAAQQGALQALAQLCSAEGLPARWQGLRLWPARPGGADAPAPVAVCLHLYYLELWPTLWQQLRLIPPPWDLYLSVPVFAASPQLARIAQDHPRTVFRPLPNRGRDVAPLLQWLQDGAFDGHALVCKLHGKHSPHRADGAAWRDSLLDGLLGSTDRIEAIVQRFQQAPRLGLLAPNSALQRPTEAPGWAKNARGVAALAQRLGLGDAAQAGAGVRSSAAGIPTDTLFAAGTMFWFRPQALQRLRRLGNAPHLFPPEMHQTDGTPAHALERLMGACARADGYAVAGWPLGVLPGQG